MGEFFRVATPEQVYAVLGAFPRLAVETVGLDEALHRVCSSDIAAPEDLPPHPRATMDGYAVRAADTFGASEALPALLDVAGSVVMGEIPAIVAGPGRAVAIPTGGFLPPGADAVVMVEHTAPAGERAIEVSRPVTAGENILDRAEDTARGEVVIPAGTRLQAQAIGLLAGLGITRIPVYRRPRVTVLSTGDEIVPVTETPPPGRIRDINGHAVAALVRAAGGEAQRLEAVADDPGRLRGALERALAVADVVVLSGGSSVGERDHILRVVSALPGAAVHVHGVAISPGKPTLVAGVGTTPVIGLPGHPVSALVVAQVFLVPLLNHLEGEPLRRGPAGARVRATLATSVPSVQGREEYVRVALEGKGARLTARPLFGKSGMLSVLVKADGFLVVPIHAEGIPAGETVEVVVFRKDGPDGA